MKLEALSERGMGKAVGEFVKKDDNDAIKAMVDHQIKDLNATLSTVSLLCEIFSTVVWCRGASVGVCFSCNVYLEVK